MNSEFWISRWKENKTGFHQEEVNPHLREYCSELNLSPGAQVFVPLCGKSLDMLWLRDQGYKVLGVELSEIAVKSFFQENNLPVEMQQEGKFLRYRSGDVEILCGDFFDLRRSHLAGTAAVYDRASLIALPAPIRPRFARHLGQLLPPGTRMILISIEYPQDEMNGPPFAVAEDEVRAIFQDEFDIHLLSAVDILEHAPRFRERGLTMLAEKVYRLERRS